MDRRLVPAELIRPSARTKPSADGPPKPHHHTTSAPVPPLTKTNTSAVLLLVQYCFSRTLTAGTLRASPALYTPQRVPMRSNGALARLPRKKIMPVGTNPRSAGLSPWPHWPSAEKTFTTRLRLSAAEDFARSRSCPRSRKMYKSQGKGVRHRRTHAHEPVLAEGEILSLLAAYNSNIRYQLGTFSSLPPAAIAPEKQRMQVDVSFGGVG